MKWISLEKDKKLSQLSPHFSQKKERKKLNMFYHRWNSSFLLFLWKTKNRKNWTCNQQKENLTFTQSSTIVIETQNMIFSSFQLTKIQVQLVWSNCKWMSGLVFILLKEMWENKSFFYLSFSWNETWKILKKPFVIATFQLCVYPVLSYVIRFSVKQISLETFFKKSKKKKVCPNFDLY